MAEVSSIKASVAEELMQRPQDLTILLECLLETAESKGVAGELAYEALEKAVSRGVRQSRACKAYGIARSTFYYRKTRGPTAREQRDRELAERITAIQQANQFTIGVDRMYLMLRDDGFDRKPGRNQVARVMREYGLNARMR